MKRAALMLALLASCTGPGAHQVEDAGAGDAGSRWLCFCGGNRAITCTNHKPICSATDPSKAVAKSEHTTCSCRESGACTPDADCLEVH